MDALLVNTTGTIPEMAWTFWEMVDLRSTLSIFILEDEFNIDFKVNQGLPFTWPYVRCL